MPPEGQSVVFAKALRDAGATVTALPVPNTDHFWFPVSPITGKKARPIARNIPRRNLLAAERRPTISSFPSCWSFFRATCDKRASRADRRIAPDKAQTGSVCQQQSSAGVHHVR